MGGVAVLEQARGLVAVVDAKLPARAVAIGVDRGLRHPQFARDLLGAQVPVDQPQALPFPGGEKRHWINVSVKGFPHSVSSKRCIATLAHFGTTGLHGRSHRPLTAR